MPDFSHSWLGPLEDTQGAWDRGGEPGSLGSLGSFTRLWQTFMTARVTIASVLLVLHVFIYALGSTSDHWSIVVCIAYLIATVAFRITARPRPPGSSFDAQWLATIGVDVAAFSMLNFLQSSGINYTPLFALPVLLASVLGPILLAFGTAASVTLLLLGDAWWQSLQSAGVAAPRFLQSGLSGFGFFVIALLANQLALRLAREERMAKSSQALARTQRRVNELVIETLSEGVLVADARACVWAANPASRVLLDTADLGQTSSFRLTAEPAWSPLDELVQLTFTACRPQQKEVLLQTPNGDKRRLMVRTRLADSSDTAGESLCVMFLQDLRELEAHVRTAKMAALGRMSAAVAHEIRNPLAAIIQANALLEEDLQSASQLQLTGMVGKNAQRLAKIVEEIFNVTRAKASGSLIQAEVALDEVAAAITQEWARQSGCTGRVCVTPGAPYALVAFDVEHLRRVMINLLDNALRYASTTEGSIRVDTQRLPQRLRLAVWSDGKPLEKAVQAHLFEPFFSSESRSTGLGLYICRELCERYGAVIGYRRTDRGAAQGNEFFVDFDTAAAPYATGRNLASGN